jgi:Holliday junction resolvasome RuvABC endonuclease subunit
VAGIDPDTKAITTVIMDDAGHSVSRMEAKGRRAEDRIQKLYQALQGTTLINVPPIDWVYIETPVLAQFRGKANAKALRDQAQVVGMIRYWLWEQNLPHSMVDNGTWKKSVLGNGKASKQETADYAQRVLGLLEDIPQDVYDAACIAEFGRKTNGWHTDQ